MDDSRSSRHRTAQSLTNVRLATHSHRFAAEGKLCA